LTKEAASSWLLATGYWRGLATLCRLGLGLGDPWATQGPRKGHPSVAQGRPKRRFMLSMFVCNKSWKMGGGVVPRAPYRPWKAKPYRW